MIIALGLLLSCAVRSVAPQPYSPPLPAVRAETDAAESTGIKERVSTIWPSLSAPPPVGGGAQDAAVLIAIEEYTHISDVPGARQNALDWYRYLTRGRQIPPQRVKMLLDGQATREEIAVALQDATDQVGAGGTLWFLFIGHGAPSADGRDGLLLDVDVRQTALSVSSRGLSQRALIEGLQSRDQGRAFVILDACFSGHGSDGDVLVADLQPVVPTYALPVAEEVAILSAGRSDQYAGPLPGLGRPAFSYLTLGALHGWADEDEDGVVSSSDIQRYTTAALQSVLTGRRQHPQHSGADANFPTAQRPGPDLSAVRLALAQDRPVAPTPTPSPAPQPPPQPSVVRNSSPPTEGYATVVVHACPRRQVGVAPTALTWTINGRKDTLLSSVGLAVDVPPGQTVLSVERLGARVETSLQTEAGQVYHYTAKVDTKDPFHPFFDTSLHPLALTAGEASLSACLWTMRRNGAGKTHLIRIRDESIERRTKEVELQFGRYPRYH